MASLGPAPFEFNLDDGNCAIQWRNWLRGFELFAKASGIDKSPMKTEWLLTCAGSKVQEVYFSLPDDEDTEEGEENKGPLITGYVPFEKDPYVGALSKLEGFFAPKKCSSYERHVFRKIHQKKGERFDSLLMRLRTQADRCNFGSKLDENVKDQITIGCSSGLLQRKILERGDESLESVIKLARVCESAIDQQKSLGDCSRHEVSESPRLPQMLRDPQTDPVTQANSNVEVCKIEASRYNDRPGYYNKRKFDSSNHERTNYQNGECDRCGFRGHKSNDPRCPAKGKKCNKCGKMDHFIKKCYTKDASLREDDEYEPKHKAKREPVRLVLGSSSGTPVRLIQPTSQDERPLNTIVRAVEAEYDDVFCIFSKDGAANRIWCKVGSIELEMIVDSGTKYNIIDRETWLELKAKGVHVHKYYDETDVAFSAYGGHRLRFLGMVETKIQVGSEVIIAKFYVADEVGKPLLGWETAIPLKVLKIGNDVNKIEGKPVGELTKIKGILVEIPTNDDIQPVQQPYRRVPAPMEKRVDEKVESMLEAGIIERVQTSKWISPLVMQPKPDGDVRICVDMRRANESVIREYHPLPTIDEFLPYLGDAKYFSKIDVRQAFHQVELAPNSREITTFITKKGLFQYKRLMFGISCAPEIFQKIMEQLLSGCTGCCIFMDDILIYGATREMHDERLTAILKRLKEFNVTLNEEKCVYCSTSVTFLGHKLSENGIQPTSDKVESVKRFRAPRSVEEVSSFLGLVNYVSKFIPDLATVAEPLRLLTRNQSTFMWGEQQQNAFATLKNLLAEETTLGYYNIKDRTRIIADASPTGLGAVLIQFQSLGPRVISYASRSLSQTERKYAQTEKEALALVWAVEKFHFYIFGREFELVTDHQSLERIFSPKSKPCARIERWVMRLQSYKYKVVYQPGKKNIADPLSRLVNEESDMSIASQMDEDYINWIVSQAEPKAIKLDEIRNASISDRAILAVKKGVYDNDWTNEASPYKHFETEFCFHDDILLRTTKIVLPECLWQRAMELSHEGHPGMSVMKKRLRAKLWWPKMDQQIEEFVRKCKSCTLVSAPPVPEPMKRRELPSAPWEHLAVDFLGPLPSRHNLLVVVDYYSRFIEVEVMGSKIGDTDTTETIKRLKSIFARFGLPLSMQADGGPQFISNEFKQFCITNNIHLNNTIPYWPQQNGEVERQNRSILKRLQISQAEKRNWIEDLQDYLLMYRSTPHSTTLRSPAELMFNRNIRDKLPSIRDTLVAKLPSIRDTFVADEELRDRDKEMKSIGKNYADERRNAKFSEIRKGDHVLIKRQEKSNKLATMYEPTIYKVVDRIGSEIVVENAETLSRYRRNVAHAKKFSTPEDTPEKDSTSVSTDPPSQPAEQGNSTTPVATKSPKLSIGESAEKTSSRPILEEEISQEGKRKKTLPKRYDDYVLKNVESFD